MEALLPLLVGVLFATGFYMVLRRSLTKLVMGLGLLTNAANLLIFTAGSPIRDRPPLIEAGAATLALPAADPLPQALILTAIVIGFGVQAFALVLVYRTFQTVGTDDPDEMQSTDEPGLQLAAPADSAEDPA